MGGIWQFFWLVLLFEPSHPELSGQWHRVQKAFIRTYSCGNSSGLSDASLPRQTGIPDSLFIRRYGCTFETKSRTNVGNKKRKKKRKF